MTMLSNEAWESTFETRTLQSWKSSCLIRSWIACNCEIENCLERSLWTYTSTDRNGGNLSFKTRDKLGSLAIEELDAVSRYSVI
jgi:hypothetical protein